VRTHHRNELARLSDNGVRPRFEVQDVVGTVGQVLAGHRSGRTSADQITLLDSVGIGAQDLAIADLLVREARLRGIGMELDLNG
jgi:alanine dehydrogenase